MGLRFCLITTFFPPEHFGGDAIVVAHLASLLASAGHEVDVIHCVNSFRLLRGTVAPSPVALHPAVRVHRLDSAWGPLSPLLTHLTGRPLLKPLRKLLSRDYDVIHWHNLSLAGGPGALPLGGGVRLCTLHDYWLMCPTSVLYRYNRETCRERTCVRCTLYHGRPPQLWRYSSLLREGAAAIHRFIAPSNYVRLRFAGGPLAISAEVIPNFLPDDSPLHPRPERPDYYLFAGRLEKLKGLQTILPLFRKTGRRLKIAGAGRYEDELRGLAGAAPGIEFLGRVPYSDLGKLYAGAIATLVPSVCEETFGLTILESARQGTPSIVSSFGALPETVRAAAAGYVYASVDELESILMKCESASSPFRPNLASYAPSAYLQRYMQLIDDVRRT